MGTSRASCVSTFSTSDMREYRRQRPLSTSPWKPCSQPSAPRGPQGRWRRNVRYSRRRAFALQAYWPPNGSEHRAVELDERRFRRRLGLEHIDAARKNTAGRHKIGKGLFVNDAPPRAVFTMTTPSFIWANCSAANIWYVPSVRGTCTVMKSAMGSTSSMESNSATPSWLARAAEQYGSKPTTRMPNAWARFGNETANAPKTQK